MRPRCHPELSGSTAASTRIRRSLRRPVGYRPVCLRSKPSPDVAVAWLPPCEEPNLVLISAHARSATRNLVFDLRGRFDTTCLSRADATMQYGRPRPIDTWPPIRRHTSPPTATGRDLSDKPDSGKITLVFVEVLGTCCRQAVSLRWGPVRTMRRLLGPMVSLQISRTSCSFPGYQLYLPYSEEGQERREIGRF